MEFRRTILKQELAVKLFANSLNPDSAMQLLRKEIRQSKNLKRQLYENGCTNQLQYFNHKQIEIILEHFCISPEEFEQL
jgi:uncharacterized protein YqeY